jgi:hypothetical protein
MVDDRARVVRGNGEHLQILVVDHHQRMIIRAEQRLGWNGRQGITPLAACRFLGDEDLRDECGTRVSPPPSGHCS